MLIELALKRLKIDEVKKKQKDREIQSKNMQFTRNSARKKRINHTSMGFKHNIQGSPLQS